MGNITALTYHPPGKSESCVIGDHVYLMLTHAELVDVVDALHGADKLTLEQRLASVLRTMPGSNEVRPPALRDVGIRLLR